MTSGEQKAKALGWPDLTVDQRAWEQAKAELGTTASVSDLAQRAQRLKARMLASVEEDEMERARR
jgi:hypothetical protein